MNINFYFYPIILILGIASSYTDVKSKAIRNRHLILSLGAAFLIYVYLILTKRIIINPALIINIFLGATIGFMLYFIEIWGAGDGKLFFVYCLLIPSTKYSNLFVFPCLTLFLNIFLVSLGGIVIISLPALIRKFPSILKKIFSLNLLKNILMPFLIIFSFSWIFWSYIEKFKLPMPLLFKFIAVLLLYQLIAKTIRKIKQVVPLKLQPSIFLSLIAGGLILKKIVQPYSFSLARLSQYFKYILCYSLIIHILKTVVNTEGSEENKKNDKHIPFAIFMFIGAVTVNTELINIIMRALRSLIH